MYLRIYLNPIAAVRRFEGRTPKVDVRVKKDEVGPYFESYRNIVTIPDDLKEYVTTKAHLKAIGCSNHPAEGYYERDGVKAFVNYFVNSGHQNPNEIIQWELEVFTDEGHEAALKMYEDIRKGSLQPKEPYIRTPQADAA